MKTFYIYFQLLSSLVFVVACTCDDESEFTYSVHKPIYTSIDEFRTGFGTTIPRDIDQPGRIYYKDRYIYINEIDEGIHIIDNRNPSSPKKIGFITIPGNRDLAAKGDHMYADSYIDLLVLDISDPTRVELMARKEGVFAGYHYWGGLVDEFNGRIITDFEEVVYTDCNSSSEEDFSRLVDVNAFHRNSSLASAESVGTGGSMARFTIYDNYLYTVDGYDMRLFDIEEPTSPEPEGRINLGWGIETIFPYGNKLFIGARNGMHIYDNADPESPQWLSTYSHVNSCDPVVVRDDYAFVTLRSGTECDGFANQLDVVNISDLTNPILHKTYEMQNPHGLGVNGNCLFITEGDFGLKYFDAGNVDNIELLQHNPGRHSIDVIALDRTLMVIGNDGFHQYVYDCDAGTWGYLSTVGILL